MQIPEIKIDLFLARRMAARAVELLTPFCQQIEVAGQLRLGAVSVSGLSLVVEPNRVVDELGLFENALKIDPFFTNFVNAWQYIKGDVGTHQKILRLLPGGIPLALTIAEKDNFGLMLAKATGPYEFNQWMTRNLASRRYMTIDGLLYKKPTKRTARTLRPVPDEAHLFAIFNLEWMEPVHRYAFALKRNEAYAYATSHNKHVGDQSSD